MCCFKYFKKTSETLYIIKSHEDRKFKLTIIYMNNDLFFYRNGCDLKICLTRNEAKQIIKVLLANNYYVYYEKFPVQS